MLSIIKNLLGEYKNTANVSILGGPSYQTENLYTGDIFITNFYDSSISVLDGDNYTNIANISVGRSPSAIVADSPFYDDTDSIYVANFGSDSVSVINAYTYKLRVGVSLEAEPSHAGQIECGGTDVPTNQYFYIDFASSCTARANEGFQFTSWIEDLGNNSTRTINSTTPSYSPIKWITDALRIGTNDTTSTLTPTKFGNFIARFEQVPPPFPSEYLIPLYGIIVSSIVGWSIPSIVSWYRSKKEGGRLFTIHKEISRIYNDGRVDRSDVESLDNVKIIIENEYSKGNITSEHYAQVNGQTIMKFTKNYSILLNLATKVIRHSPK
jgi:YVTN family beta-propeller protein